MFIYTVQPGDSLFSISEKYDVAVDVIRRVNGLVNPNIVPGQALVMDTNIYTIQSGDNFYTISRQAYVSVDEIIAANPSINPNILQPGMKINLPSPQKYLAATFNYFYVTGTVEDQRLINDFAPYTTYYSFFEYHVQLDGTLSLLDDLSAIEAVWNSHTVPLATITNLTPTGFSGELISQILNNSLRRQNLIDHIFALISRKEYFGVNIDFEGVLPEDRDVFSTFLTELGELLQANGYLLTIAVPPKSRDDVPWYEGYDYGAIGSVVDKMFIMAYDWHHSASEPGPVAPIDQVRETVEYALKQMDQTKIILGVPLYGYDWTLPYDPAVMATAISNQDAIDLAMNSQVPISYSEESESPYFYYVDGFGWDHVVWFEDARSIIAKMKLIHDYELEGIGAWQVGLGFFPGPWLLMNFFTIKKP